MKFLIISDLHYEVRTFRGIDESEAWDWLMSVVDYHKPDLLLSCGDWGSAVMLDEIYNLLEKTIVLTIYGNHENMSVLEGLRNIKESLPVLLRDGEIYEIGNLRIAGINGIVSVRKRAKAGIPRKRPEEFLNIAERLRDRSVDILLMHEAPFLPQLYPYQRKSEGSIVALKAIEIVKPKLVLNGHMHGCCYSYYEFPWGSKYLRIESSMHEKCYAIFNVKRSEIDVFKDRKPINRFKLEECANMIVATADVHYTKTRRKKFKREKEKLKNAIAFVVAGDITVKGGIAEAYWFAEIFKDVNIPKLYVLGNHDYWLYNFYEGRSKYTDFYEHLKDVNRAMKVNGFHNLSDSPVIIDDIAFCGVCGWWDGSLEELIELSEEDKKLKQKIVSNDVFHLPANITPEKLIKGDLEILSAQLEEVSDIPYKVCVMHFSPIVETLTGCSKAEYKYMGSRKFFDITQKFDLVIHGHAHNGNRNPVKIGNTWYFNVSFEVHKEFVKIYKINHS